MAAIALSQYGDRSSIVRAELNAMLMDKRLDIARWEKTLCQPLNRLSARKFVAVVRLEDYTRAVDVAQARSRRQSLFWNLRSRVRAQLRLSLQLERLSGNSVCVGVGTVLEAKDAESAIDAGAEFVVTPAVRRQVIATCVKRQTLVLGGGFTPTELLEAYEAGAELVKVFPAGGWADPNSSKMCWRLCLSSNWYQPVESAQRMPMIIFLLVLWRLVLEEIWCPTN